MNYCAKYCVFSWSTFSQFLRTDFYSRICTLIILIWYYTHKRNKDTQHTWESNDWQTPNSYLYQTEWIIPWYQRYSKKSKISLLFKNYLLSEISCLMTRFSKTKFFPWNTNNEDRNGVNKQNTYKHQILRER